MVSYMYFFQLRLSEHFSWALITWRMDWTVSDSLAVNYGAESSKPELTWSLSSFSFSSLKDTQVWLGENGKVWSDKVWNYYIQK